MKGQTAPGWEKRSTNAVTSEKVKLKSQRTATSIHNTLPASSLPYAARDGLTRKKNDFLNCTTLTETAGREFRTFSQESTILMDSGLTTV
jgi:hypothetical protein